MRTTLTLDDDVAKMLQQEMRRSGKSWKQTVNDCLRSGFRMSRQPARRPFEVKGWKMGLPTGLSYDCIPALLEALDGPFHK